MFVRNILSGLGTKGILLLLQLISVPVLINSLGIERYGVFIVIQSLIGYGAFLDGGVAGSLSRELALNRDNPKEFQLLYSTAILFYILLSFGILLVILLSGFFVAGSNHSVGSISSEELTTVVFILAASVPVRLMSVFCQGVLSSCEQLHEANISTVIGGIVRTLLAAMFALYSESLRITLLAFPLSFLTTLIISGVYLNRNITVSAFQLLGGNFDRLRSILSSGFGIMMVNGSGEVTQTIDKLVVAHYAGAEALAYYNVAYTAAIRVWDFSSTVSQAFLPRLARSIGAKRLEFFWNEYHKASILSISLCLLATAILFVFGEQALIVWVGDDVASKSVNLFYPLLIAVFISSPSWVNGNALIALGFSKKLGYLSVLFAILSVALAFVFVPKFGAIGAIASWGMTYCISAATQYIFIRQARSEIS